MIAAFDGATLERGILYPKLPERDGHRAFRKALGSALKAEERERALAALEGGARTLTLAFEATRDRLRAQGFYRYELIARRKQKATPPWEKSFSLVYGWTADYGGSIVRPLGVLLFGILPIFAFLFYALDLLTGVRLGSFQPFQAFWAFALFPAISLALLIPTIVILGLCMPSWRHARSGALALGVAGVLSFAWIGLQALERQVPLFGAAAETEESAPRLVDLLILGAPSEGAFDAVAFSLSNVFRPFSALAAERDPGDAGLPPSSERTFEKRLLFPNDAGLGLLARVLATLESILAILLAFLSALAVRRRFQIA